MLDKIFLLLEYSVYLFGCIGGTFVLIAAGCGMLFFLALRHKLG